MTRTVFIGSVDEKIKKIYDIVLEAQLTSLSAIKPGAVCSCVDEIARGIIRNNGYEKNFGHGLGHSVGLEIHEEPRLSPSDKSVLEQGIVITVEPGIYVEGLGGVRIEDLIVITENGYENLTSSSKDIIVIK
jgi:Xaa-Pro aminopeptidase